MRYPIFAFILPCALALSACTSVTPAYQDNGTRSGPCEQGGPDEVAQRFYDYQIQQQSADLAGLRPYLSDGLAELLDHARLEPEHSALLQGNPFSSITSADSASVASASTIPNRDARNIPLRVAFKQGDIRWKDEVLMIQEGGCWAVDDVRYLGAGAHASAGTLRQSLEKHPLK